MGRVVWSRRRCHIYRYRFDTGRERRLKIPGGIGTSDYRPTIWGRTVVFARIFAHRHGVRGAYPYLYSVRLPSGAPKRLPGGTRGTYLARHEDGPGPVSLDLHGDRLAFAWLAVLDRCPFQTEDGRARPRVRRRRALVCAAPGERELVARL
jgi:hypothetical protein